MSINKKIKWSIIASAAAALATASYGITSSLQPSAMAASPPRVIGEGSLRFPFDAYHLSAVQSAERANENNVIVRACMNDFGIAYLTSVPNITAKAAAGFAIADSRRYGITDSTAAAAYGYHLPPAARVTPAAAHGTEPALTDRQRLVLTGSAEGVPISSFASSARVVGSYNGKSIPQGGCVGTADRVLHQPVSKASYQTLNSLAATLERKDFIRAQSQPRVLAVFSKWTKCMAAHHYHYRNPIAAATDHAWDMKKPPTRRETEVATTDVKCKQQTKLVSTEYQVEISLQRATIKQYASRLEPLKALVATQVSATQSATAKYGS